MKPCLLTICLTMGLATNLIPVEGFGEPERANIHRTQNMDANLPRIDKDVEAEVVKMTSQVDRVVFLKGLVVKNPGKSLKENLQKATAFRLMGQYGGATAVPVLVENLEYEDTEHRDTPCLWALVEIGEPSVSALVGVVAEPGNKNRRGYYAVQALMRIKGSEYEAFIMKQKGVMNDEEWTNFIRYAVY